MECPKCGNKTSKVVYTKPVEMNTFRLRRCLVCNEKFYTEECVISVSEASSYYAAIVDTRKKEVNLNG